MTSKPWAGWTPATLDLARELPAGLADAGYVDEAAAAYAELAGADPDAPAGMIDLSNVDAMLDEQFSQAAQVASEDSAPQPRSAEARLAHALGRISRGTYQPAGPLEFSSPSSAARELARARWGAHQPGPVTGRPNCGASDDLGYCCNAQHDATCGSLATARTAAAASSPCPPGRQSEAARGKRPKADQ